MLAIDAGNLEPADGGDAAVYADADADAAPAEAGGHPDAEPLDAGRVLSPCGDDAATCSRSEMCGTPEPPPGNCESCTAPYYRSLCIAETCTSPALLDAADVHELTFTVNANVGTLASLVWFAIARDTPSGMRVSCADVYDGAVDFTNTCFNLLDIRTREIVQPGDTYAVLLGGFASGLETMFIVRGFEDGRGGGNALGISCTEYQVGPPGTGVIRFAGDPMRAL
jgi:hypothetical protein